MNVTPEMRGWFVGELTDIWEHCLKHAVETGNIKSAMAITLALEVLEQTYLTDSQATGLVVFSGV